MMVPAVFVPTMVMLAMCMALVPIRCTRRQGIRRHQPHAALRARPRLGGRDLWLHGTDVGDRGRRLRLSGHQLHSALRTCSWLRRDDLGVHGTDVGGGCLYFSAVQERHRGDDREYLVRLSLE